MKLEAGKTRVGVVMLTWNQRQMTLEGLASLRELNVPQPRVVLVDNGSTDETVEAVAREFPEVHCLRLLLNQGFCAANNRGAEILLKDPAIDCILFVNNDIEIDPP